MEKAVRRARAGSVKSERQKAFDMEEVVKTLPDTVKEALESMKRADRARQREAEPEFPLTKYHQVL